MTLHFNITPLKKRRRYLRSHLPKAEVLLWMHLSNRQMLGYKFRRQYSVDKFVIDFYCPELRLAIEVDGDSHVTPRARVYDRGRQHHIESFGIRFLRVMNEDVYHNLDAVLDEIAATIRSIEGRGQQPPLC
jgi:very-short-patch-repair endonuclease